MMQRNFYEKETDKTAYQIAQRINKIPHEHESDLEMRRVPSELRDRVEYYMQLFHHKKQKGD